ncbi:envelope stress response membrane protein PspC [Desulfomicrobium sp. ZS1]|uniref:envelope stress response membrane protein PspC n=1 Tax=Desulfomicrobium sp. ZS1 TaxID=2952228 RepID=UPI0020B3E2C8|nr:envelope stress response membrane protein PspC [Desulfomicrobium sp. ZS1]UTF51649.1 envelope stress response membrane protein PspC [Desulfomicrobium sp. ZS1]
MRAFGRGNGRMRGGGFQGSRWRRPVDEQRDLYRARNGVFLGVCNGIARYFDIAPGAVRAVVILLFLVTGIWPVGLLYLIAAMVMKMEPVVPFNGPADQEFYNSYTSSRAGALERIKRKFDSLDRRLRRMEDVVTSRDFEWERRMRNS